MLFSKRVWILIALAFAAKTLVTPLIPGASPDFTSWVQLSQDVSGQIQAGIVPQLGRYGAYTFMGVLLVPFFLAWSALPVAHPAYVVGLLTQPLSIEQYSLIFMMKLPINLCDFFTGLMIAVISRKFNPNVATKAFWLWYLNPYTTLMMEYYGTFDIVPTLILLGASYLGLQRKWVGSGFLLSIGSMLRVFPLFAFPFFSLYAFRQSKRAIAGFLISFVTPIVLVLAGQAAVIGSVTGVIGVLFNLPVNQPWLLIFIGFPLSTFVNLTLFLLVIEVYLVAKFWKSKASIVDAALVATLIPLLSSYHEPYHITWVLPLLTIYFVINSDWAILYALIFVTSFLSTTTFYPSGPTDFTTIYLQPLFGGLFYGVKTVYLLRVNLKSFGWNTATVSASISGIPKAVEPPFVS